MARYKVVVLLAAVILGFGALLWPWAPAQDRTLVRLVDKLQGQWVGRQAPFFSLPDLDGKTHTLPEYRGKVIFLNVWASFCAPCRQEMPSMERLVRDYKDRGMEMLAVTVDPEKEDAAEFMRAFLPGQRSAMTVLHDPQSQTAHQFGTELLPETYLIGRDGRIIARFVNAYDWQRPEVKELIDHLLSQPAGGHSRAWF